MFDHHSEADIRDVFCLICPKCSTAKYISHNDWDRIVTIKKR